MALHIGLVGLPNVGKSTLFNALTKAGATVAPYPFTTIEPNRGVVAVPDSRLEMLVQMVGPEKVRPATVEFVDIAGLVKGAHQGEGLGNQFLGHIRSVDAVALVCRCFANPDVVHVEGKVDPIADAETIETELMLADLDSLERRVPILEKKIRGQDKEAKQTIALLERLLPLLRDGKPARALEIDEDERVLFKTLGLLTSKPILYVCNVDEVASGTGNAFSAKVEERAKSEGAGCVIISAQIESELAELGPDERKAYLAELGLPEPGLNRLIYEGYKLLHLITYFTVGPKEARAWTISQGTLAPQAAGVIHTDFENGFIRAETIAFDEYVDLGGESGARDAGKLRLEGKDYLVKDGDVLHFRFAN